MSEVISKSDLRQCIMMIDALYRLVASWRENGKPDEGDSNWPHMNLGFESLGGYSWAETDVLRRRPGPRNRYRRLKEYAPMGVSGMIGNTLHVAIRGTYLSREWDTDFKFHSRPYALNGVDLGWVHDGFADTYASMLEDVHADIREATQSRTVNRILVTGHSLGAAVATLLFADLLTSSNLLSPLPSQIDCFLFGSPRVGNDTFQAAIAIHSGNLVRFENTGDPIVGIPLTQTGPFAYEHAGQAIPVNYNTGNPMGNHSLVAYLTGIEQMTDPIA